jgi:hypothetical protein
MATEMRKTLVAWAIETGLSVDLLRREIRESDTLKALGVKFGPVRTYSREEFEQVRKSLADRRGAGCA